MFEIPAVLPQDHEQTSAVNNAKGFFRKLEADEIHKLLKSDCPEDVQLKYVERVRAETNLKGEQVTEKFVGLTSNGVFNSAGELIGDVFSENFRASIGHKKHAKFLTVFTRLQNLDDTSDEESQDQNDEYADRRKYEKMLKIESYRAVSAVGPHIIAMNSGVHLLPRNTCRPKVCMDNKATQLFVHSAQQHNPRQISDNAKAVLMRSNYRAPFSLLFCHHDDYWHNHQFLRRRSLQVTTSLMYISLERRDYERAWTSVALLIREPFIDLQLLWMPALELLAWRTTQVQTSKTPNDFLDWLIVNFPDSAISRLKKHRVMARAHVFVPVQIMLKLSAGKFNAALQQAEQAVSSAAFNHDSLCWALCGIATLKANSGMQKAQSCFKKCLDLGGVLPHPMHKLLVEATDESMTYEGEESSEETGEAEEKDEVDDEGEDDGEEAQSDSATSVKDNPSPQSPSDADSTHNKRRKLDEDSNDDSNEDGDDDNGVTGVSPLSSQQYFTQKEPSDTTPVAYPGFPEETQEIYSVSQPFYSQDSAIGGQLGASDSEDDEGPEIYSASQPFYSQEGGIGGQLGSESEDESIDMDYASQPSYSQKYAIDQSSSSEDDEGSDMDTGSQPFYTQRESTDQQSGTDSEDEKAGMDSISPQLSSQKDDVGGQLGSDTERDEESQGDEESQSSPVSKPSESHENEGPEIYSASQPFYSQEGTIGGELGSSESEVEL